MENERKIKAKMDKMPDEVEFIDEDGKVIKEFGVIDMTPEMKYAVASLSIKWHQSIEKTFLRMIMSGVKSMDKKDKK